MRPVQHGARQEQSDDVLTTLSRFQYERNPRLLSQRNRRRTKPE
jgi:hypothetical protein